VPASPAEILGTKVVQVPRLVSCRRPNTTSTCDFEQMYYKTDSNSYSQTKYKNSMKVSVYTDGACTNNGKRGARAAYAYYFPAHNVLSDAGKIPDDQPQTNNRGELSAILHGVNKALASFTPSDVALHLFTDSDYCKNCLTLWMPGWIKKNWMTSAGTPVLNRDLIEEISGKLVMFESYCITWVRAHTGGSDEQSKNNEIVDRMATEVLEGPREIKKIEVVSGSPLQLMGPPIDEKDLVKWCLANLDKIDKDALGSALLSAYGKTCKKNGTEMVKQKLHRTTQYRLIASTHIITEIHKEQE
jgi:ribonuclease HI